MNIYALLYFTIFLSYFLIVKFIYKENKEKGKKVFTVFIFAFIILLLGLRNENIGVDLGTIPGSGYLQGFLNISHFKFSEILFIKYMNYEHGYIILNKIISVFSTNINYFLFVMSILSVFPVGYLIYKESDNKLLSVIIYLGLQIFLAPFSALRQSVALGVCIYSYKYIKNKNFLKFLICILIASCFHFSAAIFIIAYPMFYLKINNKVAFINLMILFVIYVFRSQIFILLSKLIKENVIIDNNGALMYFIFLIILYVFCMIFKKKNDSEYNGLLNFLFICCIIQSFGGLYSTAIRMGWYFMPYIMILLPKALNNMNGTKIKQKNIVLVTFIIFFTIIGYRNVITPSWAECFPYYFYWQTYLGG